MLREFAREKEYANDYWGGHKGSVHGEAKDPFKLFRWMGRKLSGDKGKPEGLTAGVKPVDWAKDGEVGRGDVDCSRVC